VVFTADDHHFNVRLDAAIEVLCQSHASEATTHDDDSEPVGFFSDVGHIRLRRAT
jgi:hypothetical protein